MELPTEGSAESPVRSEERLGSSKVTACTAPEGAPNKR